MTDPATPRRGAIDPRVEADLPGLALWELTAPSALHRRRDPDVRDRLRELAGRITGAVAIEARQDEIVHAYRVAFRHTGLDPDVDRTPYEAALVERLRHGGFPSRDVITDALLLALLDTKVAVVACDDASLRGPLHLTLEDGAVVLADDDRTVIPLWEEPVRELLPTADTVAVRLAAVTPAGVPAVAAWEALDRVADLVAPG
ncbi:hypothetical protein LRS13_22770 [Svornostia abyssi]|uniref:Uncharacterized protein n=1 Tax=Svornostia abyssi TaxID=2898438 RepID=A0ABY5PG28_9ACTN|nr:hypothetical protein LRS13_22770 [Parviterribacteraceae bacterium J379]